jgi:hypothetical protein
VPVILNPGPTAPGRHGVGSEKKISKTGFGFKGFKKNFAGTLARRIAFQTSSDQINQIVQLDGD